MSQSKKYYINAFFLFCKDKRKEFEKKYKRALSAKELGIEWDAFKDTEEGKEYIKRGQENRDEWNKERQERLKRYRKERKEKKKKMEKEKKKSKKKIEEMPEMNEEKKQSKKKNEEKNEEEKPEMDEEKKQSKKKNEEEKPGVNEWNIFSKKKIKIFPGEDMEELRKEAYGELHNNPFLKSAPKDEEKEKENNFHQKEKENKNNPFLFNQEEKEKNLNPSPKKDDKIENNFQKKRIQKMLLFK